MRRFPHGHRGTVITLRVSRPIAAFVTTSTVTVSVVELTTLSRKSRHANTTAILHAIYSIFYAVQAIIRIGSHTVLTSRRTWADVVFTIET